MGRMFDMIRQNAVPAAVMRSASRGALSVPGDEMLEILVFLTGNPIFAQQARMTLAGWDEKSAVAVLGAASASPDVVRYFWTPENRRPALLPALLEHPAVPEEQISEFARSASRENLNFLLKSPRVRASSTVMQVLVRNENLTGAEVEELGGRGAAETTPTPGSDSNVDSAHQVFHQEHAAEIAAEQGKAFELTDATSDERSAVASASPVTPTPAATAAAAPVPAPEEKPKPRETMLQRIMHMTVDQRIKAAFGGGREERAVLIRDGSRIVQSAVLASPRLTDQEVETFAAAKNVQENVLREIARNRKFMKSYTVVCNLVNNPRCPLDISLKLIKNLLVSDLKYLQMNKNVPDTVRKVATKMYKQKVTSGGKPAE